MSDPEGPQVLTRRAFFIRTLAALGGVFAAAVAVPVIGFGTAPFWRAKSDVKLLSTAVSPVLRGSGWASAGKLGEFTVGEPRLVTLTREVLDGWVKQEAKVACYVVRTGDAEVVAFDHHCTHLGCPLSWSAGAKRFLCPCHGGEFDVTGRVKAGPPPRSMLGYETRIDAGEVMVGSLQEGI